MILPRHRRVILWGLHGPTGDSFQHIWRHYAHALEDAQKPWLWLPDTRLSRQQLTEGDLVFAVDVAAHRLGAPVDGVDYLLHNVGEDHPVREGLDRDRLLFLQVFTNDCEGRGESWGPVRRWDRHGRVLYQPWGTDRLPHELGSPVFNPDSTQAVFVGSVWDGNGQGNREQINDAISVLQARGLRFEHHAGVSDERNAQLVREARLAPAVAGRWQVEHEYLPCRVFKNVSYGTLGATNVPRFRDVFGDAAVVEDTVEGLIDRMLGIGAYEWHDRTVAQQEIVAAEYTYRTSLEMIGRAFDD